MRQRRGQERGALLVETALTLTAFLMLLFAVCDLGQYLFVHHMLTERIRSSVRRGAASEFDATGVQNLVLYNTMDPAPEAQPYLGLSRSMVLVDRLGAGTPEDRIRITVQGYRFRLVTPFLSGYGYTGRMTYWLPMEKHGS